MVTDDYFKAAQHGNLDHLKKLHASYGRKSAILNAPYEKSGDTVLHIAARCGHLNLVEYLVALGADVEASNFDGKRPLHEAAQSGHAPCVQSLLRAGAQIDSLKRADW